MGWLWGANETKPKPKPKAQPPNSNTDPLRDLDPSLRDFLQTESPSTHKPPPSATSPKPPSEPVPTSSSLNSTPDVSSSTSAAPMVYPDGRYADLWSSYRPLSVIEDEVKTDQEKLQDVLEGYKDRKVMIGRAALENCALEQSEVNECIKNGGWMKRMTLCRQENKAFERCYVMQSKFLKALGYLSSPRPAIVEERIQMHADTLFHRMLAQEAAIAAAKASKEPVPAFPPIMPSSPSSASFSPSSPASSSSSSSSSSSTALPPSSETTPSPTSTDNSRIPSPSPTQQQKSPLLTHRPAELFSKEHLSPAAREALEKRMKDETPEERELEERAVAMEGRQTDAITRKVASMLEESQRKRRERREKGEGTIGDYISWWFRR